MNHATKCMLLVYMDDNPADLTDTQLTDYLWMVEQLLQELRQVTVIRRNTPINTPTGSQEWREQHADSPG